MQSYAGSSNSNKEPLLPRKLIPTASEKSSAQTMPALPRKPIPTVEINPLAASLPTLPRPSLLDTLSHELKFSTDLYSHVVAHSHDSLPSDVAAGKMSLPTAILTFLKAMLGPLLLFAPHMFAEAGALLAAVMLLIVGVLSMLGMSRLVEVQDALIGTAKGSSSTYAEVGGHAVGPIGFLLVESCLAVSQWLYCVGYPIFVARNMQYVLAAFLPAPPPLPLLTLIQLPILIPYCWIRDLHYLGYPMLMANVCLWGSLVIIFTLVGQTLVNNAAENTAPPLALARFGFGTLLFTAQAVVAFEGIGLVLPIRDAMSEPKRFPIVLIGCMTAGTCTLLLVGFSAYAAFGDGTATFVTLNIEGPLALGVRAAFSLAVILTYPLQLFPAVQALEAQLGLLAPLPLNASGHERTVRLVWQCIARTCLVCAAFAFALYAPYDNLVGLAGGLCAVPLAFIFPGWFHLQVCKGGGKALDLLLVGFGLVMAPVAVVAAIVSWR